MARTLLCKLLQKKTYDILSQKNAFILLFIGIVIVLVSALHFGETMLEWSKEKYSSVFNPYSDNIAGKTFRRMLCQFVPIDVVYTWVNGTDPKFLKGLAHAREEYGFTSSHTNSCSLSQCVRSHMALVKPQLPNSVTLSDLEEADPAFEDISGTFIVGSPYDNHQNITVLIFPSIEIANHVIEKNTFTLQGQNYTISTAYITDNWMSQNTILLKDIFMMTQVPSGYSEDQIIEKLPVTVKDAILKVFLHEEKSLVVLTVGDRQALDTIMKLDNVSFENKVASITAANLVVELPSGHEDISASRFTDNEELRYSLRSLEKHAPWVQHIYIVTNGQIPHWLNLDNPRVTIVTHEEIFPNKSHLPTFSSPSIECHLHRIPNLSKKFLYLNDDVMFGKDIWPEDFYTHMKGQKVYLSWPVPNCAEGCPSSWIRDGYCDKPCNNSQCQWDGGDCSGDNPLLPYQSGVIHQEGSMSSFFQAGTEKSYCNQDCANSWLADRYCDKACNTIKCGFDAGDCGTDNYNQLYKLILSDTQHEYHMPQGETIGFFNLTEFISNNYTVTEGFYDDHPVVRSLAISLKYSVLTVVLHPGHNTTNLTVTLKGERLKQPFERIFFLIVNTRQEIKTENENSKLEIRTTNITETEEPLIFEEFPDNLRFPKVLIKEVTEEQYVQFSNVNVTASQLPVKIVQLIEDLDAQYKRDELSEKGYLKKKSEVIYSYIASLNSQNMPLLVYETGQKIIPNINYTRTSGIPTSGIPVLINNLFPISKKDNVNFSLNTENNKPDISVQYQPQNNSYIELVKNITKKQNIKVLKVNGKDNEELSKNPKPLYLQDVINNPTVHSKDPEEKPTPSLISYFEKLGNISSKVNHTIKQFAYETSSVKQRHLLDTFGDSLRHVNKLYNDAFGYEARKVPSHIAHLVDVDVMSRLAFRFAHALDVTSSHKIRSSDDMQFAFSYYYYLMSEMESVNLREVFDLFDTDHSGTWSDREIRTVLTRLHDLPLDFVAVHEFEENIINCSASFPELHKSFSTPLYERYYDSKLPTVTKTLILSCGPIANMLLQQFGNRKKNKYEVVGEDEVAFKMIHNNLSQVLGQIDDIRKNPRKFVCLNDNMNHGTKEAEVIRAVIQDFYESLFPIRSQFELPPEYRNRFLYIEELRDWRRLRDFIRIATYVCLGLLILFSATSFWKAEVRPSNRNMGSRPSRQHNRNSYQV